VPSFTVEEILAAAEQNKYPNTNETYIGYKETKEGDTDKTRVVEACVIGEAFLNLGLVENGVDASSLSYALARILPDESVIELNVTDSFGYESTQTYRNLSDFINDLNGYKGYRGKKRIVRLARKYFSRSLNQVVSF